MALLTVEEKIDRLRALLTDPRDPMIQSAKTTKSREEPFIDGEPDASVKSREGTSCPNKWPIRNKEESH